MVNEADDCSGINCMYVCMYVMSWKLRKWFQADQYEGRVEDNKLFMICESMIRDTRDEFTDWRSVLNMGNGGQWWCLFYWERKMHKYTVYWWVTECQVSRCMNGMMEGELERPVFSVNCCKVYWNTMGWTYRTNCTPENCSECRGVQRTQRWSGDGLQGAGMECGPQCWSVHNAN